jgi:alkane 1-monooxygenase
VWTARWPIISYGVYLLSGGAMAATLIPVLFVFGLIPFLDAVFGEDANNPPAEVVAAMEADPYYRRLAIATVPLFWLSYLAAVAFVGTQDLPWWSYVALILGVGTINGGAIALGHELGHKQHRVDQMFGSLANNVVGYAHFRIEHNRGHHTWVATPEDPASSRFGESIYRFALRELPGSFVRGWRNESERLTRRGRRVLSVHNEILQGLALTLFVAAVLIAAFGWKVAPFILAHHFIGWYSLTQANYIEHYGLLRDKGPNGRYLPVEPRHSWNTNHILSNLLTFHLQRHSDHHANPMRALPVAARFQGTAAAAERLSRHVCACRDPAAMVPRDESEDARRGRRRCFTAQCGVIPAPRGWKASSADLTHAGACLTIHPGLFVLPPPPLSADRKKSPPQVSRKREYFRYGPETFGIFSLKLPNFGA